MKYSFRSRVRYSEMDAGGHLSLHGVLNYFQDCSTFQSEAVGAGMEFVRKKQRVWVLSSWQVVVDRYPLLGEELVISTWAYDFKGFLGMRNFTIETEKGERLAYANSVWSYLNSQTGIPAKLEEEDVSGYGLEPRLSMDYAPRKIPVPKEGREYSKIVVTEELLDTNRHVNNGQYVALAQRYLPEDFPVYQMRAEYKRQTRLGDILVPVISEIPNGYVVTLNTQEGVLCAAVEFTARKENV